MRPHRLADYCQPEGKRTKVERFAFYPCPFTFRAMVDRGADWFPRVLRVAQNLGQSRVYAGRGPASQLQRSGWIHDGNSRPKPDALGG